MAIQIIRITLDEFYSIQCNHDWNTTYPYESDSNPRCKCVRCNNCGVLKKESNSGSIEPYISILQVGCLMSNKKILK